MKRLLSASALMLLGACAEPPIPAPIPEDAAARFAAAVCAGQRTCNCSLFADDDACEAHVLELFEDRKAQMRGFDEACFDTLLTDGRFDSCLPVDEYDIFDWKCKVMHGDIGVGEPCEKSTVLNEIGPEFPCVQGAYCSDRTGLCTIKEVPAPTEKPAGAPCDDRFENNCGYLSTYCHGDECRLEPEDGAPCFHERACVPGSFCQGLYQDGEGVCTPRFESGAPCDLDDFLPCAISGGYVRCNPATLTCDGFYPYLCSSMMLYLRDIW